MKPSQLQTMILIGVTLLFLSGVMIYTSLSSPKEYVQVTSQYQVNQNQIVTQVQEQTQQQYQTQVGAVESTTAFIIVTNPQTVSNNIPQTTKTTNAQTTAFSGVLNLNTCTQEQLQQINGIGEKRAFLIVAYRSQIGGYTSVDQIKNISGIGDKIFEQISPYLAV